MRLYVQWAFLLALAACSEQGSVGSPNPTSSSSAGSTGGTTVASTAGSTGGTAQSSTSAASASSSSGASAGSSTGVSSTSSSGTSGSSGSTTGGVDAGPALGCDCRQAPCACGGPVPICLADSGTCVQCRGEADCAGKPLSHCGSEGLCVACAQDRDCAAPRGRCAPSGGCVACLQDSDCARWSPEAGRCETDPANFNFGACVPCTAKAPTCSAAQASTDVSAAHGSDAPTCDTVRDLCSTLNPIPAPPVTCDIANGQCSTDSDCQASCLDATSGLTVPSNWVCLGGVCAQCRSDSNCQGTVGASGQATPRCDLDPSSPSFTNCVQCTHQADCNLSDGDLCLTGPQACELDCRTDAGAGTCGYGVGGELTGLNDCDPDTGFCVACLHDSECPGSSCDLRAHACRATQVGSCLASTQCAPGQVCVYPQTGILQLWGSLAQAASGQPLFSAGSVTTGACSCAADVDCGGGGLTCQGASGGLSGTCQ